MIKAGIPVAVYSTVRVNLSRWAESIWIDGREFETYIEDIPTMVMAFKRRVMKEMGIEPMTADD